MSVSFTTFLKTLTNLYASIVCCMRNLIKPELHCFQITIKNCRHASHIQLLIHLYSLTDEMSNVTACMNRGWNRKYKPNTSKDPYGFPSVRWGQWLVSPMADIPVKFTNSSVLFLIIDVNFLIINITNAISNPFQVSIHCREWAKIIYGIAI